MEPEVTIKRRKSRQIHVGSVPVGGDAPIAVQSMTNTNTCDVDATVTQIKAIQEAGADIVRVSVPSMEAAEAFGRLPEGDLTAEQVAGVSGAFAGLCALAASLAAWGARRPRTPTRLPPCCGQRCGAHAKVLEVATWVGTPLRLRT